MSFTDEKFINAVTENDTLFIEKNLSEWKNLREGDHDIDDDICCEIRSKQVLKLLFPTIYEYREDAVVYILESILVDPTIWARERLRMVYYITRNSLSEYDFDCADGTNILIKYAESGFFPEVLVISKAIHGHARSKEGRL